MDDKKRSEELGKIADELLEILKKNEITFEELGYLIIRLHIKAISKMKL